ncbi:MAG: hypothetical protein ACLTBV_00365 [Enterocloster bolteae]
MDKPVLWNLNWKFYDYFEENLLTEDSDRCSDVNLPHTVKELPLSYFSHQETAMISTYVETALRHLPDAGEQNQFCV